MNKDRLNNTAPARAVQVAYAQVSAVQHNPPEEQVLGAAVLFRAVAEELRLDVSDLLSKAARLMDGDDTYWHREVSALRMYIRKELA